ncbi:unnamed protein product, partial [Brassica rapa subsp. trilocularis]
LLRFWDSKNIKKHDVVGKIPFVQGSDLKDAQVMTRVVVRFIFQYVLQDLCMHLSLWDEAASMFRGLISSGDRTQSVMVVTTVNPKIFGGMLYLSNFFIYSVMLLIICRCWVVEVLQQNGWSFVLCTGCSRKLDKSCTSLCCNRCVKDK